MRKVGRHWEIEGRVVHVGQAAPDDATFNHWKAVGIALGVLFLLPWLFSCMIVWFALVMATSILGGGFARRGPNMLPEIISFRLVDRLLGRQGKVNVYVHLVQCGSDTVMVRQEEEIRDGRIFAGHEVVLYGSMDGNILRMTGGLDRTTGARLTLRANSWQTIVTIELALIAAQVLILLAAMLSTGVHG